MSREKSFRPHRMSPAVWPRPLPPSDADICNLYSPSRNIFSWPEGGDIIITIISSRKQTKPIIPCSCHRTPGATASVLSRISDPQELASGQGCFPTCPRYFPGQGRLCCLGREWAAEPEPGLSQSRAKYGGDTWSQARDT